MTDNTLLPSNATPLERDISLTLDRTAEINVNLHNIHNVEDCPDHFLPWLAWAFSVDYWESDFTREQKIKAIKDSFEIHRIKGTVGAVRRALDNLGIRFDIEEWFEYGGAPYTFRVNAYADLSGENTAINEEIANKITQVVKATKNLRSHEKIRIGALMERGAHYVPQARISQMKSMTAEVFNGKKLAQNMGYIAHIRTSQIIHMTMEA